MDDARGITRGRCKNCSNCVCYTPPSHGLRCSQCGCPPGKHAKTQQRRSRSSSCDDLIELNTDALPTFSNAPLIAADQQASIAPLNRPISGNVQTDWQTAFTCVPRRAMLCAVPHCGREVSFDLNSGFEYTYCPMHASVDLTMTVDDIEDEPFMFGVHPDQAQDSPMFCGPQAPPKDSSLCSLPECLNKKYFDSTSGVTHDYCGRSHAEEGRRRGIQPDSHVQDEQGGIFPPPVSTQLHTPSGTPKCAIAECPNECYVDESGTVHECCGITHAMEHQRRQALWKQVNQQVVKGITHCLLPECDRQTWPFENYCGRTHADIGIKRGLVPPPPVTGTAAQSGPKDSSLCIIPGCQKPKFVDSSTGATHDYCGKGHAEEGKKRGIYATTDKVQDQCDLSGCTNKKKTEGGTVYDYCCLDHAKQDAPNRDAKILTSLPEVQKFLTKFPSLTVVSMKENDHAKPGGALFNKFKAAMMALPSNQRTTCLAFHGTAQSNIDSICTNGYDPSKRSGQAHGPGEYFATSPTIPLGYCKGGKKMLLNELLLGQSGTHHTKHGDIVVMKHPAHDLPRFVITFQ